MAPFTSPTLLTFILLAISNILIVPVQAAPWPLHSRHSTHRVRHVGRSQLKVSTYHPKTTFKTFGKEGLTPTTPSNLNATSLLTTTTGTPSLNDSAISFMETELGMDPSKVGYRSGFVDGSGKFAYVRQTHDGVPFVNAVANIAWNNGKVVSYGSSFVDIASTKIASSTPSLTLPSLLPSIESLLGGTYNNHPSSLEYLAKEDGSISLVHVVQIKNETEGTWFEAYVCAHTGKVESVTDFVAHASYTVLPITKQILDEGLETLIDPEDLKASPFGWHSDGKDSTTETLGNNAASFIASPNGTFSTASQTSSVLNFNTKYDDSFDPTTASNIQASLTNAFYIANTIHDVAYRYGFTEKTFNFQEDNFGNGGKGGDSVQVSVQDGSGTNNANFATPPDGQSGVCRMFIWDLTNPRKDGAMENDIIVHEMTHGITSRMTGGGSGRCLQTVEAGGMGEGWSDAMAEWVQQKDAEVRDFVVGQYVTENPAGIRSKPYSTDPKVNPLLFSDVAKLNEVHNIGEVWANMLHNVYAALVAERGFSAQALTNPDTEEGNVVYMHLFIDSLLLQPCNPTFIDARDAWIQADENRYNGANKCTIFKAFASRGLGLNAGADFKDNFDVPAGC